LALPGGAASSSLLAHTSSCIYVSAAKERPACTLL
jgi:hypothetical protein